MRRLGVVLVSLVALLAGLYLSFKINPSVSVAATQAPKNPGLVGSQQPGFELFSNTGEPVTHADFSGETILLNFWATWCVPCREEMPMLVDLQAEYSQKGFQVVGIALDEVQQVNRFMEEIGVSYPVLVGEADVMAVIANYGNATGVLPYSVLVDKQGIIRWQYAGEIKRNEVTKLLQDLL